MWPNNSASSRVSDSAPQFTGINGARRLQLRSCSARGDEFLARAGLARDEHRRVGVGHEIERLQHQPQGRVGPDEPFRKGGARHF